MQYCKTDRTEQNGDRYRTEPIDQISFSPLSTNTAYPSLAVVDALQSQHGKRHNNHPYDPNTKQAANRLSSPQASANVHKQLADSLEAFGR